MIARELNLKLEEINISPFQDPGMRRINPLGKIPALVLDDGSVLIDSPVICEYLNHVGGGKFFPGMSIFRHSSGRWKALGLQALGDGLADATVAWVLMGREEQVPEKARARQMETILARWARWRRSSTPRCPPSVKSRSPARWAIWKCASPILIGGPPTPICPAGMRNSANIRR